MKAQSRHRAVDLEWEARRRAAPFANKLEHILQLTTVCGLQNTNVNTKYKIHSMYNHPSTKKVLNVRIYARPLVSNTTDDVAPSALVFFQNGE